MKEDKQLGKQFFTELITIVIVAIIFGFIGYLQMGKIGIYYAVLPLSVLVSAIYLKLRTIILCAVGKAHDSCENNMYSVWTCDDLEENILN